MLNDSNKPKILFVASNIPTPKRKSNQVVMNIAHRLSGKFDVSVLHPAEIAPFPFNLMKKYRNLAGKKGWSDGDINVKTFRYLRLFGKKHAFDLLPCYCKKINRVCEDNIQLLHAHFILPDGYIAYEMHKMSGIPYIISVRGSDIKFLKLNHCNTKKYIDKTLSNASVIIAHNAAQHDTLAQLGYKSVIVPHGVEPEFLRPKAETDANNVTIMSVGELIPQKHLDWVIEAVKNYKGSKNITLKIAGEGPMRAELEAMAKDDANIHILGKIPHDKVGKLLEESQIFALPSVNETFGLVYIEATAHQNAVIATRGTGIWGVFDDNKEMLYCDSQESFTLMLYQLIDNDEFRNEMARKAYEKTAQRYTWDEIISRYSEIYNSCLNG